MGGRGGQSPPRLGPKKIIARPKTHTFANPLCMPQCAKTHLQQSRVSKFFGKDPGPPLQGEGRAAGKRRGKRGGEEGKTNGRREGKEREGRGGTARDREGRSEGGGIGVVWRGGQGRSTWAPL